MFDSPMSVIRASMLAGTAAIAIVAPAHAQERVSFNIPAQDLGGALQQFAVRTNLEILYSPDLVANRRTPGVSGSLSPADALRRLLSGTDLTFREAAPNVFVLQRAPRMARNASYNEAPLGTAQGAAALVQTGQAGTTAAAQGPAAPASEVRGPAGSLSGVVADTTTGTPIVGARVRIEGTNLTATTDERGIYRFPRVPSGQRTVVLEYLGEQPTVQQVTVDAGQPATLNFTRGGDRADIVVYGYTSAIQRALNQQRAALNNATIVSEDLLGGFPAETVSEALRRVPGVAFGRDDESGEGSRITVRGFSSEAINVQLNGLDLQGTNFTRTIDLSGFLAENISQVTIHKSLLPSHEATGSGGLVQIETRSGLDYGDFHFSAGIEGERAIEPGFGREFQANATIGGKLAHNFGLAATVSYRDTTRRNYDIGIQMPPSITPVLPAGFTSVFTVPASQQFPFDEGLEGALIQGVNYSQRERDETNLALSVNAAWEIGDHTRLRLDAQRNVRDVFTYSSRAAVSFLPTTINMPIQELDGERRSRVVLNSFRPSMGLSSRDLELTTNTLSLRGDTNLDRWQFRYKAGYSGARSRSTNTAINFLGNTFTNLTDIIDPATIEIHPDANGNPRVVNGAYITLPNGAVLPSFTQLGFDLIADPSTYRINNANRAMTDSPSHSWLAEASARRTFGSFLDYLEVGFKMDRNRRSAVDDLFAVTGAGLRSTETWVSIAGRNTFLSDLGGSILTGSPLQRIGLGGFGMPFITPSGHDDIFRALDGLLADDPSTPFNEERFRYTDVSALDPIRDAGALSPARSKEHKYAGYMEAHFELGQFDLVGGARIERTRRIGTTITIPSVTLNLPGFVQEHRLTFVEAGMVDFGELTATDTTITPSFLLNYRPASNIVARLGYFRSTVNPSLQLLRRQTQYLIDLRPAFNRAIVREGNPDLRPTTTDNFDLDVAYYFRDTPGLIRAGVFYKKVNNNFTNVFIQDQPASEIRERVLDFFSPLVATRPDLVAFNDDTEFLLSRPINGEGGTIWGFELEVIRQFNFLPGFLSGFGVIGNLTHTVGDFPTIVSGRDDQGNITNFTLDRPLEDQAQWVYNAALTYARGGFEGRLIYTRQSATVTGYEIHDLNSVLPAYSTLDLRMSYNFNGPGGGLYTIFLEGDNLLNGPADPDIRNAISNTFGRSDAQFFHPTTLQFSGGRMVTVGARVRF
jgi:TonB-dependent receptor